MSARGKEVYIIAGVIAVVLIVAWYFLLFSPTRQKLSDLDDQIAADKTALATAQQELARLQSYQKTAPQAEVDIVRLSKMLPEDEGIPSMIVELTKTATASGVTLSSITRGTTTAGTPFGIQTVTLAVSGRFFDVEDFLYRVESYVRFQNTTFSVTGRLFQVANVTLTGGTATTTTTGTTTEVPPLTVSVTLNAYLWGGSAAAAATPATTTEEAAP
jgi:Tfp pilus assembly protein PilO